MSIDTMDDITRRKEAQEEQDRKKKIVNTFNDVIDGVKDERARRQGLQKPKKKGFWWILALIILGMMLVNFILFNIWIFKFFLQSLF